MNLVFAAGILVPQMFLGQNYFRGVKDKYSDALFPPVAGLGDIATRAKQLAAEIQQKFPAGPIHIVAHSMGGLDSRYVISKNLNDLGEPGRIVSLSTISTPHQGSRVADLLVGPKPDVFNLGMHILYETITDTMRLLGMPAGALGDLTTTSTALFNSQHPDSAHVKYFTYAGVGLESVILKLTHTYLQITGRTPDEVQNDGIVTLASAQRTGLAESFWPTDHFGEIGYNLNTLNFESLFDHRAAIDRVIARAQTSVN